MIVDRFGRLALDAYFFFFFQRKHKGALIAAAIIIFCHAPTLCQFQPRGGLPYERGGDARRLA